uniref:Uncharacterized protein n=1 Tax=Helminthocladia australis TaxID=260093 RepID=A0A1G4NTD4_9FLOR|nr:Hypothetical protein ORF_3 [Helminthocladia australis]SCW21942.1 Hypothetical protein ORF_3 [Helminthocladia australis]
MTIIVHNNQCRELAINKTMMRKKQQELFYLQKRIYQASKECHHSLVQSLQKLLISSDSMHRLASIVVKSRHKHHENYSSNSYIEQHEIDEQLIIWCLESEWQSKLSYDTLLCNNHYYTRMWQYSLSVFPIAIQNIDHKYLVEKLQSIKWIKCRLKCKLAEQRFNQTVQSNSHLTRQYASQSSIVNLLYTIVCSGMQWSCYQQQLHQNLKYKYNINILDNDLHLTDVDLYNAFDYNIISLFFYNTSITSNFALNHYINLLGNRSEKYFKDKAILELLLSVKHLLYHKDSLGRFRVRSDRTVSLIMNSVNNTITNWQMYYCMLAHEKDFDIINHRIKLISRAWLKKRKYKLS